MKGKIQVILSSHETKNKNMKGKIQVRQLQQLTGLLNFICKAVPCGCPFLCRLYDLQAKVLPLQTVPCTKQNPHYKICLDKGAWQDLLMWENFLSSPDFLIHREVKFLHLISQNNQGLQIFADAAGNATLGFGCIFPKKGIWAYACWPLGFFKQQTPSISLLELYAIVIAVENVGTSNTGQANLPALWQWGHSFLHKQKNHQKPKNACSLYAI